MSGRNSFLQARVADGSSLQIDMGGVVQSEDLRRCGLLGATGVISGEPFTSVGLSFPGG